MLAILIQATTSPMWSEIPSELTTASNFSQTTQQNSVTKIQIQTMDEYILYY